MHLTTKLLRFQNYTDFPEEVLQTMSQYFNNRAQPFKWVCQKYFNTNNHGATCCSLIGSKMDCIIQEGWNDYCRLICISSSRASWYPSQRMTHGVNIVPGGDKKVRDKKVQKLTPTLPNGSCCSGLYAEAQSANTGNVLRKITSFSQGWWLGNCLDFFLDLFDLCEGKVSVAGYIWMAVWTFEDWVCPKEVVIKKTFLKLKHNLLVFVITKWNTAVTEGQIHHCPTSLYFLVL